MQTSTQTVRRAALYAAHREANRPNFTPGGQWVGKWPKNSAADSREWLWHAVVFLAGDKDDVQLGNVIIAATPDLANHFNSIVAVQILLHYPDRLEEGSRQKLLRIVNGDFSDNIDFASSTNSVNNFSCMRALFFLGASELIETYEVPYRHKSIPEVYNKFRIRQLGLNMLALMEQQLSRTALAVEFNSPTYSAIPLMAMADIVNCIDHAPARAAAARIERRLWEEMLAFHHPLLHHTSGPHSRAYTVDSVGHASGWKTLCCFLDLDGPTTIQDLLYPPQPGQVVHQAGNLAIQQAIACWLSLPDFHLPDDLRTRFVRRRFPYSYQGTYEWDGFGYRRPDGSVVLSVEGDYTNPGGVGVAQCYQTEVFSISSMSRTNTTHNHPCQIVYRLLDEDRPLGATRSITVNLFTHRQPETEVNALGEHAAPTLLPNNGDFIMRQNANTVRGMVEPYHWAPLYAGGKGCDEISFNLMVSEHLPVGRLVERVFLNGQPCAGSPVWISAAAGEFLIEDGKVRVRCAVQAKNVRYGVFRHGGFLRCATLLYEGPSKLFTPEELARFQIVFAITVEDRQ